MFPTVIRLGMCLLYTVETKGTTELLPLTHIEGKVNGYIIDLMQLYSLKDLALLHCGCLSPHAPPPT